jgi:hypothetical protein
VNGEEFLASLAFAWENRRAIDRAALPLAALVEEVDGWVISARDQSWVGRSAEGNRSSLIREIEASQSMVGPSLRAHVGYCLPTMSRPPGTCSGETVAMERMLRL